MIYYDNYRLTHKRGFSDDFGSSFTFEDNNIDQQEQRGSDTNEFPIYQNTEEGKEEICSSNHSGDTTPIKEEKHEANNECLTTDFNKKNDEECILQSNPPIVIESEKHIVNR